MLASSVSAQYEDRYGIYRPWPGVDSLLERMSLEEKIGQLFMIGVFSHKSAAYEANVEALVQRYHVGGLIFMKGHPHSQRRLTRRLQRLTQTPLLIAMDAEWGPAMRLDSVPSWPRQMTLGAQPNESLTHQMGQAMARQLKALGVHVNFSPVVDINSNPQNPVIHTRSFGGDKVQVTLHGRALMRGMQEERVLAVAKHFPGHGNTSVDSHFDLPVIDQSYQELYQTELYPFRELSRAGVGAVMSAHLHIPSIDDRPQRPSSLSRRITGGILRDSIGFGGLVFSDALNMQGVAKYFDPGEAAVEALKAGNDVLLYPSDLARSVAAVRKAVQQGEIPEARLDASVRRILQAKHWAGALKPASPPAQGDSLLPADTNAVADAAKALPASAQALDSLLWNPSFEALKRTIVRKAISIPLNEKRLIPIAPGLDTSVVSVAIGAPAGNAFQQRLQDYHPVKTLQLSESASEAERRAAQSQLASAGLAIVSLHDVARYDISTFGLPWEVRRFVNGLPHKERIILVHFGTPYALRLFPAFEHILLAYEGGSVYEDQAAQALFGGFPIEGKLPVTVNDRLQLLQGHLRDKPIRLRFGLPEEVGMRSEALAGIERIARKAIEEKATPGCQVLVARRNAVVYRRCFGHHTYSEQQSVEHQSLYDLASVTKIAASTLAAMRFYELGLFDPGQRLDDALPEMGLDTTNKADLHWREILAHQAGLQAWIPFYRYTLTENGMVDSQYCYRPNSLYALEVADGLYGSRNLEDTVYRIINESHLKDRGEYLYSDLGYFYLKKWIEKHITTSFDEYLRRSFYQPMGLRHTTYRPLERFPRRRIVPTEYDDYFRHQLIHGHVHDPAAAMLGGVAGHAGLFSTATDMATLMQMFLNGGTYGGARFFSPQTIERFTRQQFPGNRKGMGFDRPVMEAGAPSPAAPSASSEAFGHTGFTGTSVWADPRYELVYVFLSNRIHPDAANKKLITEDIRTRIHQLAYDALEALPPAETRKREP